MFGELIKLRELGRLLRKRRHLEVLALARDPAIRDHRKAVVAAEKARAALLRDAEELKDRGEIAEAFQKVRAILQDTEDPAIRRLEGELRQAMGEREAERHALDAEVRRARGVAEAGDVQRALARLEPLAADHAGAREAVRDIKRRESERKDNLDRARAALDQKELADARDAIVELRRRGAEPEMIASLHADLLKLVIKSDDTDQLAFALTDTKGVCAGDEAFRTARKKAASQFVTRIEKALKSGELDPATRWLATFPLGTSDDETALGWARALRVLERARRMDREGDQELARRLGEEARDALPPSPALKEFLDGLAQRQKSAKGPLAEARRAIAEGRLIVGRKALVELLDAQPGHREALDLLDTLENQDREDRDALHKARQQMDAQSVPALEEARRLLTGLSARRPDLDEVPVLLQDVERRTREARLAALNDESRLLSVHADRPGAATRSTVRGPIEPPAAPGRPGLRPVVFKSLGEVQGSEGNLARGLPFVLRVEEHGDCFVHPGASVLIGNATRGVADLPILAAIGSRHARIERQGDGGSAKYRLVPVPGRKVTRNRRTVRSHAELSHGDVIGLGPTLTITFLRPVAGSATALLELGGDFTVKGCRRVLLFAETGRAGSIVVGPGPHAHVPMAPDHERVELLRGTSGDSQGVLLARSPRGIAVGDGSDRPQVRVRPGLPLRAGRVGLFVDPA